MQYSVHGAETPGPKQSRFAFLSTDDIGASGIVKVLWGIRKEVDNIIQETIYMKESETNSKGINRHMSVGKGKVYYSYPLPLFITLNSIWPPDSKTLR